MSTRPLLPKQLSSVGDFKLGLPLGQGNHAIIREGISKIDGNAVVIKELAKSTASANSVLMQEAIIMEKLHHPNLVELYGHFETNDRLFLVMEYAQDGDLLEAIIKNSKNRIMVATAKKYFAQMVLGVEYMHSQNVIHLDLKPDNIFVDNGRVMIGDFGLSRFYNDRKKAIVARPGTLHYSAPECFSNWLLLQGWDDVEGFFAKLGVPLVKNTSHVVVYGPELDVWAMGVVLYVMLTGKYPFWGSGNTAAEEDYTSIEAILFQEQPRYPFWIDCDCVNLLGKIFDKNPNSRITIEELKRHPWIADSIREELQEKRKPSTSFDINSGNMESLATLVQVMTPPTGRKSGLGDVDEHYSSNDFNLSPNVSPACSPCQSPIYSPIHSPMGSPYCSPSVSPSNNLGNAGKPLSPMITHRSKASRSNLLMLHKFSAHTDLVALAEQARSCNNASTESSPEKMNRRRANHKQRARSPIPGRLSRDTSLNPQELSPPVRHTNSRSPRDLRHNLVRMHRDFSRFSNLLVAAEQQPVIKTPPD